VSVFVETFGTNTIPEAEISRRVRANFDLTPRGIIQLLDLTRPIYSQTAKNGHLGHPEFGWEKTDQAAKLAS
jgi:S-adenosylmethionine synthetase